ncbi:MAG: UDP-N-acetylmuramoyl-L-alanine--D-glutamate ligase [Kiritimatiellia bacterium]|nr:UDP-N-acetylmuramoyl-L-alanine--D-glutamate ligase [Kiritimatiellia bacterium]
MDNIYKSALILGLAASGEAAARLLLSEGAKVKVLDENKTDAILCRAEGLEKHGAEVIVGSSKTPAGNYDVCIVSPGVRPNSPVLSEVLSRGIPVLPEFELGWTRAKCPVIAVTGSNGKSTLVKLCAEALQLAGLKAFAAGNYGPPVSQIVLDHPEADRLVIEVSSFQLETVRDFRPDIAVLLNVFPNHLDRHHDLGSYIGIKARIFARMTDKNRAIVNESNLPEINERLDGRLPLLSFGLSKSADYFFSENSVTVRAAGQKINFADTIFTNEVLGLTAAAAAAVVDLGGVSVSYLERAAREFQPLPHRMKNVGQRNGVQFVDDSKATNVAALLAALKMASGKVHLIAGGLPKNESYGPVAPLLAEKAREVYLIGKSATEMAAAWRNIVPCRLCGTLEEAVAEAWRRSVPGETILLSPACASFDQFRSFEERGDSFRRLFESLETSRP